MFHVEPENLAQGRCFTWNSDHLADLLRRNKNHGHETIRPPMISLDRYTALLAQPAFRSALLTSILGRLPIGITGLAILLLGQTATGSFASGGALAASYTAGLAIVAPLLG